MDSLKSDRTIIHDEDIDDHQHLYSLDVYVKHVVHLYSGSETYLRDVRDNENCCIGFRLWDFPLLYINQQYGKGSEVTYSQNDRERRSLSSAQRRHRGAIQDESIVMINSGKSCVFKMADVNLKRNLISCPLFIFLFTMLPDDFNIMRPKLVGSASITIESLGVPVDEDPSLSISSTYFKHNKRILSGTFTLMNDRGFEVGVIDMDLSIRRLKRDSFPSFSRELGGTNFSRSFSLKRTLDDNSFSQSKSTTIANNDETCFDIKTRPTQTIQPIRSELGTLSQMVDNYRIQEQHVKQMKETIRTTVADISNQLSTINMKINGTGLVAAKKKKKKRKVKAERRDSELVTSGYYSSSIRIGTRTVNGKVFVKNKDGTLSKPKAKRSTAPRTKEGQNICRDELPRKNLETEDSKLSIARCTIENDGPQKRLTLSFNLPESTKIVSAQSSSNSNSKPETEQVHQSELVTTKEQPILRLDLNNDRSTGGDQPSRPKPEPHNALESPQEEISIRKSLIERNLQVPRYQSNQPAHDGTPESPMFNSRPAHYPIQDSHNFEDEFEEDFPVNDSSQKPPSNHDSTPEQLEEVRSDEDDFDEEYSTSARSSDDDQQYMYEDGLSRSYEDDRI